MTWTPVQHWIPALLLFLLCIFIADVGKAYDTPTSNDPKLLLIHLDGVSLELLRTEMDNGNLPAMKRYFGDAGLVETAITYYPSKTPLVISSIRSATPSREGELVGWEMPVRGDDKNQTLPETFVQMMGSKMRPARSTLLYGLPFAGWMNHIALMNTTDLFDTYPIIEYYWYLVDTFGHFRGEEEYLKALKSFDRRLGRLLEQLDRDVNVVIYSDHGMVFGDGIDKEEILIDSIADEIDFFSYPSVYLHHPEKKEAIARQLVELTPLDFAFVLIDSTRAKGFHEHGTIEFHYRDGLLRYQFDGDQDPLGFDAISYDGGWLSADEWLLKTIDTEYPAAPVTIFSFLLNERAGHIVTSFNDTKYARSGYSKMGNHGGFTAEELKVPVMVYGPDVQYVGSFETLWLQELFNELQDFTFGQTPRRDVSYLSGLYDPRREKARTTVALSPAYRFRLGADFSYGDFSDFDFDRVWGEYDIFRSYIARLWLGGGVDFTKKDTIGMFMLRYELRYRNWLAEASVTTARNNHLIMGYRFHPNLQLELTNFTGLGFRIRF
ncbi:MAG: alkaline phosphatase family protein [Balneolaceae bacterium]